MIKINNAIIEKASQPVSGQSEKGEWHKVDFVIRFSPRTSSDGKMYYDRLCLTAFNNMGLQQLVLQLAGTDSMVDISINCAVSEYNGRWFNQLRRAYTVSSVSVTDVKPKKQPQTLEQNKAPIPPPLPPLPPISPVGGLPF